MEDRDQMHDGCSCPNCEVLAWDIMEAEEDGDIASTKTRRCNNDQIP
jgi:hypothetical protein